MRTRLKAPMPDSAAPPLIQSAMQWTVTVGIPAILALGVKFIRAATRTELNIAYVQKDIGDVKKDIKGLETQFIAHLESGYDYARRR